MNRLTFFALAALMTLPGLAFAQDEQEPLEPESPPPIANYAGRHADPTPPPVVAWYILADGHRQGPMSEPQLYRAIETGTVENDTMVWNPKMGDWALAGTVENLAPRIAQARKNPVSSRVLHGFRTGMMYINGVPKVRGISNPLTSVLGYEMMFRLIGEDALDAIIVTNFMMIGLDQSRFLPAGNGLFGVEIAKSLQFGVGLNVAPGPRPLHLIVAAGYMPRVGSFHVPIHVSYVPDIDGNFRIATTVGLNW